MIRPATVNDADAIATIYNHYVLNTWVTFEEEALTADDIQQRMQDIVNAGLPYIVAEYEGSIVGYAYAAPFHKRAAYRKTVETTVYLKHDFLGRGFGKLIYEVLLGQLKETGYHAVVGTLGLPNEKSVALHEKLGFKQASHLREVGFKFGEWRDVGHWQLIL
jgi:L-amino acid N-acyltransferase YncA